MGGSWLFENREQSMQALPTLIMSFVLITGAPQQMKVYRLNLS
jgi:hypothetical protein